MGIVKKIYCDLCGADCTDRHYFVSIYHRTENFLEILEKDGSDTIFFCESCFNKWFSILPIYQVAKWAVDSDEDYDDEEW